MKMGMNYPFLDLILNSQYILLINSYHPAFYNSLNANIYAVYSSVSEGNQLYGNNFIDNSAQFLTYQNCTQFWDNGYNQGNYWSDYIGDDADGNGIGDTPYIIDEENQDSYPLMSPVELPIIPVEDGRDSQPQEEPSESPEETTPEDMTPDETEPQEEETSDDGRKGIPGFSTMSILIGVMLGLILFSGIAQRTSRSPQ